MVDAQLNIFDSIVIGVFFLSCLIAFFRGFIREVLSLGAWVGAGIITVYFFPQSTEFMKAYTKSETVAAGVGALGTYISALLVISIINAVIIRYVKTGAEVGMLDNVLGLMFGALRGGFIISLGFLVLTFTMREEDYPDWIKEAQTRELAEHGAKLLAKAAPGYINELTSLRDSMQKQQQEQQPGEDPGSYGWQNRLQMDRLIDSQQQPTPPGSLPPSTPNAQPSPP